MKKKLLNIVTAVALFLFPIINFAQAPPLGSSAGFVLFTSTGAVTNTGISQLTGNVGTNSGSSTGFGNVNGVMHDNDLASAQASADVLIAYNFLNSAIPTFFIAPALGNGDTLIPGVYNINGVTTLNGDLFLNAQGDANAVFIFQIQAAFSTAFASKIKLINGAQACNIFWKVEGLVSMASETFMKGTIIANNAAISMSVNDTLQGRALSTSGAITLNGILGYIPSGCGSAVLTGPAAPLLGAASCYALFTGNGAMTNSGTTMVTGDVGTNVGLTTGFNPLFVNGTIHPIPDGSTMACAASLLTVYNYLNTLPYDIELLYPAQFGRNLVLTPHTYIMNAATALTDTLFLNAEGNNNAVFVIQINGALSTSTFSKVILINGAQARNVYWKVDGAVSINDFSIFNGTIVCNNGAISIASGVQITGRALTTNGEFTTASIIANLPVANCISTPVNWLSFTAENKNSSGFLKWSTASEIDNDHFDIQRSNDGINFSTIGSVPAANSSNGANTYSYTDHNITKGSNFYRLKQVDRDARYKFSSVVHLNFTDAGWIIFPNPAITKTTIQVTNGLSNASFLLYDNNGKQVYKRSLPVVSGMESFDIPLSHLGRGIYILKITSDTESKTEKIIVQ